MGAARCAGTPDNASSAFQTVRLQGSSLDDLQSLDEARGLFIANLPTGLADIDVLAGTVVAHVSLGARVFHVRAAGPRAVACVVRGSLVQLELEGYDDT